MKKAAILIIVLLFLTGCGEAERDPYDSSNDVYVLDLVLDTEQNALSVEGELYYKNDDHDLDELYVMIDPNAYNPGPDARNVVFSYVRIDGEDVAYDITGEDGTALHIALGTTLSKGERISITFRYRFRYWDFDRIAAYGDYYLTMFFYPRVAMYDDAGWNVEPYSFRGETYYNKIGDYHVTLDVPEDYLVACGGKLSGKETAGGRTVLEYELLDARDFSFSASSLYRQYERTADGVDFSIYAARDLSAAEVEESFTYLTTTLAVMERDIGDYRYDHFTLEYGNFYGMESSGVIYCSMDILEGTVVHELIHQWFYSMIGNDQADESFLDEALTTYATAFYYRERYGMGGYNGYLDYRTSLKPEFAEKYAANLGVSLLRQVDDYGEYYGYLIYYHGPAMFRYYVDEFLAGDIDAMAAILGVYYRENVLKIATLDGFLDLLERESGVDVTKEWFDLQLNEFQDFDNRP